ncbi:MAG: alpha/beta fold hydrolase [Phycisphaerales bacterium]|nr:alpha/beta fold hydrolase [Phycisphaerales bacterium]
MLDRFAKLPSSLDGKARTVRLGGAGDIPALLIHPDWISCVPTVVWMHGRTANKELDAGRYVRWMKAGFAACAIDLPGHGERKDARADAPGEALGVLAAMITEIDHIVEALADPVWQNVFDLDRLGIGGMSLGGMATLRRLCAPPPHPFKCAAVESTTGDLTGLYRPDGPRPWGTSYPLEQIAPLDPLQHIEGFRPIPLLALHSEADRIIPIGLQRGFLDRLRTRYTAQNADPALITLHTWPTTGAPEEHSGFGRHGNEAKNLQTEFLARHLKM